MLRTIFVVLAMGLVYPAQIVEVKDADTFAMEIKIWPKIILERDIRLYGVDTWETTRRREIRIGSIRYRPNEQEIALGKKAKAWVEEKIKGETIHILYQNEDKYGRVLATVLVGEEDLSQLLIKNCHGIPYDGKTYGEPASGCTSPRPSEKTPLTKHSF